MKSTTWLHPFLTLPAFLLLLLAMTAPALFARPKTDVLVMENGDRITCEIKVLENGQLKIKTDYTIGTIPVNWTKVARIESKQFFRVEMNTGVFHTGVIELLPDSEDVEKDFRISGDDERREVSQPDVVEIEQLERSWTSNLNGAIDAGLGFTKSNSTADITLNASLEYKTEKREIRNTYSGTLRRQTANPSPFTSPIMATVAPRVGKGAPPSISYMRDWAERPDWVDSAM